MATPNYDLLARQNGGMNLDSLATAAGGQEVPSPQPTGSAPYSGAPDEPLQRPWFDPAGGGSVQEGLLNAITLGGGGLELARGLGGLIGGVAERAGPGLGGRLATAVTRDVGPIGLGARVARAFKPAEEAVSPAAVAVAKKLGIPVEQAAAEIAKPLGAHEAQLFRSGGMAAVVKERIAQAAEGAPEGFVKVAEHVRALPKSGATAEEAAPAAEKAAEAAPRKPIRPGRGPKPKPGLPNRGLKVLGKGNPTTPGPSFEVPGQMQNDLQNSVLLQQKMNELGFSPEEQQLVWQQLRAQGGAQ